MSASYRSNLPAVLGTTHRAEDAGLVAAAAVLSTAVKRGLAAGYTSGDFVTGNVLGSINTSRPASEGAVRVIRVGTNAMRDGYSYPLGWELGHQNPWTRRYERKEVWVPALVEQRDAMAAAFRQAALLAMGRA